MNVNAAAAGAQGLAIPFDHHRLDRLMDQAGIDVIVVTSKHNAQYFTGGHRANFFDYMDASGLSRYLPVFVYPKGAPEKAAYIGHRLEGFQVRAQPLWVPETQTNSGTSVDAVEKAAAYMAKAGFKIQRMAVEFAFLPYDAAKVLRDAYPDADWVDAVHVMERQRLKKSPAELALLKQASERVLASMQAVIEHTAPGATKADVVEALRREEVGRGLTFEYCLITAGTNLNRAPTEQRWEKGDIMSIDSGGQYRGYIGDICRMAIHGEPDAELQDMLAEIETIQRAAMKPIKAGAPGRVIYEAAEPLRAKSKYQPLDFLAHGMGLVSHEAPHLTATGPIPYPATDADLPLEAGTVISVETTLPHPKRGFVKLEDTVVVTDTGFEIYGEGLRGWNRAGIRA
ncbi:MAG: aminopeptidase P family protein [Proteobacteria bacterium]|nr:aminopeptidase P family protein [Pseudomonadota bacterium]